MGITYNPANSGTTYCDNGGAWFLNNSQVATFSGSSSYTKEDIPPGKRITWDLGSHTLNNPTNYSYRIIAANYWQGKIAYRLANGSITAYRYSRPFFDTGTPTLNACFPGNSSGFQARLSNGSITGILRHLHDELVTQEIYPNGGGDCTTHSIQRARTGTGFVPSNAPKQLEITDGTQIFVYNITNTNSIQVVDIASNDAKFTFNINGTQQVITAAKTSTVYVVCNCPPRTLDCGDCCLSCDDTLNGIAAIRALLARKILLNKVIQ